MAILNLEDLSGTVETVVFRDLYKDAYHLLLTDTPLLVAGPNLIKASRATRLKLFEIHLLSDIKKKSVTRLDINLSSTGLYEKTC